MPLFLPIALGLITTSLLFNPLKAADITISDAQTSKQNLIDNDMLTVTSDGSIILNDKAIDGPNKSNLSITNNGVISGTGRNNTIDVANSTNVSIVNTGLLESGYKAIEANGTSDFSLNNTGRVLSSEYAISISHSTRGSITNTGLISGDKYAVDSAGGNTTALVINNHGTLRSNGTSSTLKIRENTVINNYGLIEQQQSGQKTIDITGTGNTLLLGENSRIIGKIKSNDSDNEISFDVGATQSYLYEVEESNGDVSLIDLDGRPMVEGSAKSAGIGNLETVDELMADRSHYLHNAVDRLNRQADGPSDRRALVDIYSGSESRNRDSKASTYDLDSTGLTVALPVGFAGLSGIFFVNYHDVELDITSGTHEIDGESIRLGFTVPELFALGDIDMGLYGVIGQNQFDGTREVLVNVDTSTGFIHQDASWDSLDFELAASATITHAVNKQWHWHNVGRLGVHLEDIDGYTESDDFQWDSRTVLQGYGQIATGLTYRPNADLEVYGTASLTQRDVTSGERADYRIDGTAVSYQGGYYDALQVALRLGALHRVNDQLGFSVEALGSDSNQADTGWALSLGVNAQF